VCFFRRKGRETTQKAGYYDNSRKEFGFWLMSNLLVVPNMSAA
jgi:hypothetical protein